MSAFATTVSSLPSWTRVDTSKLVISIAVIALAVSSIALVILFPPAAVAFGLMGTCIFTFSAALIGGCSLLYLIRKVNELYHYRIKKFMKSSFTLRYYNRETRSIEEEKICGKKAIRLLYGSRIGPILVGLFGHRWSLISRLYGWWQGLSLTKRHIRPFIKAFNINAEEFEQPIKSFANFQDFFSRKLKPETRPIDRNAAVVLPADCRCLVIPQVTKATQFYVKDQKFCLERLLPPDIANQYKNGSMAICRLNPADYHRYHFPITGKIIQRGQIKGSLYSVNPLALQGKRFRSLWENKREYTMIDTSKTDYDIGEVCMVEIGATCVGTICQTKTEGFIKKGEEKGYFRFGGSCVILLFKQGKINFSQDLLENSQNPKDPLETKCKYGTPLATSAVNSIA